MKSLNDVTLIGALGVDPELRATGGGTSVCNFRMATSESWKDKDGQLQERTEWHTIVVWEKQGAKACASVLKKGSKVFVKGRIQTRQWDDKDGNKRYSTEIVATDVGFLDSKGKDGGGSTKQEPAEDAFANL